MGITKRQNQILFYIIDEYIDNPTPVGSITILKKYMPNISAATIRNEMATLEKLKLLEKVHNSSGRVPSFEAYKMYESTIKNSNIDKDLIKELKLIFGKRNISINQIIQESTSLISTTLNLPLVITEISDHELLKGINFIQTAENLAIIIIITSTGGVHKNIIEFQDIKEMVDMSVCVRIFNDYLIDVKMTELLEKIENLKPIIAKKVENYEKNLQLVISKIFNNNPAFKINIKGQSKLLVQPEFEDRETLKKVIDILEKTSIWQQIAYEESQKGGLTRIIFGDEIGEKNLSIASTSILIGDTISQISIIGPTRMDYTNVKAILEFIKQGLSRLWKK